MEGKLPKGVPLPGPRATKAYFSRIKRGPTAKDGPGWLYAFTLVKDARYIKIGRTKRDPRIRLKEWPGSKLILAIYVSHNAFAERICHLLLDTVRIYRYKDESGSYIDVWKHNGKYVDANETRPTRRLRKEIEWFDIKRKNIEPLFLTVATICDGN